MFNELDVDSLMKAERVAKESIARTTLITIPDNGSVFPSLSVCRRASHGGGAMAPATLQPRGILKNKRRRNGTKSGRSKRGRGTAGCEGTALLIAVPKTIYSFMSVRGTAKG